TPVEWTDFYSVAVDEPAPPQTRLPPPAESLDFASYGRRIADLVPRGVRLPPETAPFKAAAVHLNEFMIFNIADYGHTLLNDFFVPGSQYRRPEFRPPSQIAAVGNEGVINCTGYGARALWRDDSVTPVRGQIARLIPQADVHYGLSYKHVYVVPRRDGIVVQAVDGGDMKGYGNATENVDRAESDRAVTTLAELFAPPLWRGQPTASS